MKNFIFFILIATSITASAQTKMGLEAVEMFNVLNHHQVKDCLRDIDNKLVNVEIQKEVLRCPGCTTYTITGNELEIDVPRVEKTKIVIAGKGIYGSLRRFIQMYSCTIKR